MKKVLSLLLAVLMTLSLATVATAAEVTLKPADVDEKSAKIYTPEIHIGEFEHKEYFMFRDVDLTGINSIGVTATVNLRNTSSNGETLVIMADDYKRGEPLGYITLSDDGENIKEYTSINKIDGVHDLYFYCLYGKGTGNASMRIHDITLYEKGFVNPDYDKFVDDSFIKDVYSDTWAATDSYGRAVANYEETGAPKEDGREIGMLYWNWHIGEGPNNHAGVIPEVVKNNPDAMNDFNHPAWDEQAKYYWGEPVLGFYSSYDYWVYRKHAEMMAIAGVDAIFFDYTNGGWDYISTLNVIAEAFRDAKASGIDIPKFSIFSHMGSDYDICYRNLMAVYANCFIEHDYSDIWYFLDGKPLLFGNAVPERAVNAADSGNLMERKLIKDAEEFFTFRMNGGRNDRTFNNYWMWLENFPQVLRNVDKETGRPEFVVVGTAINQSTVYGNGMTGVFSDPYSKGRGFSEVFGEDYSENGMREGYFFREQANLALEAEPEFIMLDGWNELITTRYDVYGIFKGVVYVDTYDYENSRDFEPVRGPIKDDYYNLLCDFVRKFKGVRPVPTLSRAKTIDITADATQWAGVGPEYFNYYQDYERDSYGLGVHHTETDEVHHYTTKVENAIKGGKVSVDNDNFYFLVTTEKDIKTGTKGFLTLYINTDRNYATGWEGYDYAVNLAGDKVLSKYNGTWETIGNVNYAVKGNALQMAIPRSLIGETGTVDFEFKWTDSVENPDDLLNFYAEGSVAPYGRFNYVFTEIAETALTDSERTVLKDAETTIIKAGAPKMIVKGAKMKVFEADTRVSAFMENGTLYIPETAYNEIMGYGRSKTEYNAAYNRFFTRHFELSENLEEIINSTWTTCELDSLDVLIGGREAKLSNPIVYRNGIFYIPASFIAECYGWEVKELGNGIFTISRNAADINTVNAVLSHIN